MVGRPFCSSSVNRFRIDITADSHSHYSFESNVGAGPLHLGNHRGHPKLTPALRGPCPHKVEFDARRRGCLYARWPFLSLGGRAESSIWRSFYGLFTQVPTADFSVIDPYRMMPTDGSAETSTQPAVHA